MLHVALYQPEIPPNTGNIIRLCANTGAQLHLIHPLGFQLKDKQLRRAGLDYHEWANIQEHPNFLAFKKALGTQRIFACTTKSINHYTEPCYQPGDVFLFGPETRGLPKDILSDNFLTSTIRIPMQKESRSLNLSNTVAIVLFEAWRQLDFQ